MSEQAGSTEEQPELTQETYKETPYQDASWEVIGAFGETEEFTPMSVAVLPGESLLVDPMFANFGGVQGEAQQVRWHLPEHLSHKSGEEREAQSSEPGKLSLTQEELDRARNEALQQGRLEAIEEAATKNAENLMRMRERITAILQDIAKQQQEGIAAVERMGVELALEISRKIIGTAVEINPEYIVGVVREAVAQSGTATIRKIRVSPEDMEFIKIVGLPRDLKDQATEWRFESDDTVRAGCVVETSAGEIDFQLDKAWERVKEQVVKVLR